MLSNLLLESHMVSKPYVDIPSGPLGTLLFGLGKDTV